jgi:hypothetical protein
MRGRHRGVEEAFKEGTAWSDHDQNVLAASTTTRVLHIMTQEDVK